MLKMETPNGMLEPMPPAVRATVNDGAIRALWKLKLDTVDIAGQLKMKPSDVANRLAALLDAEHAQ